MRLEAGRIIPAGQEEALPLEYAKDVDPDGKARKRANLNYHQRANGKHEAGYSVDDSTAIIEGLRLAVLGVLPAPAVADDGKREEFTEPDDPREWVEALTKLARLGQQASLRESIGSNILSQIVEQIAPRITATVAVPGVETQRELPPPAQ